MQSEKVESPYYMISRDLQQLYDGYQGNVIKLCSNESPLGANPRVISCLTNELNKVHLYPAAENIVLQKLVADNYDLGNEYIIFGNGSTELLDLITQELFPYSGEALISQYSYPLYQMLVTKYGGKVKILPVNNWKINTDHFLDNLEVNTKAIYIANPNNPTGSWVTFNKLKAFMDNVPKKVTVVIDEAYGEYLDIQEEYQSAISLITQYNNLVVTRTFSKIYGLAGLRIGYALSHPDFISKIRKRKQSTNVNLLAQSAAIVAYQDTEYKSNVYEEVKRSAMYLCRELQLLDVAFLYNGTNFMLIRAKDSALSLYKRLLNYGIVTQPMDFYHLPEFIRISMGNYSDMQYFISILTEVMENE